MASLKAYREEISNKYSNIPLHGMADFSRKYKVKIKSKLETVEKIPGGLGAVKKKIDAYISKNENGGSQAEDWLENGKEWEKNKGWLMDLRHDYLHFSARLETGHMPRTSFWAGERYRMIYNG